MRRKVAGAIWWTLAGPPVSGTVGASDFPKVMISESDLKALAVVPSKQGILDHGQGPSSCFPPAAYFPNVYTPSGSQSELFHFYKL